MTSNARPCTRRNRDGSACANTVAGNTKDCGLHDRAPAARTPRRVAPQHGPALGQPAYGTAPAVADPFVDAADDDATGNAWGTAPEPTAAPAGKVRALDVPPPRHDHLADAVVADRGYGRADVAAYPSSIEPTTVPDLIEAGVGPDRAARWADTRFTFGTEIVELEEAGVDPAGAERWPGRFLGTEIARLHADGVRPDEAARWSHRFDGYDIAYLRRNGFGPAHAAAYPDWMDSRQIADGARHGLTPDAAATFFAEPVDADDYELILQAL